MSHPEALLILRSPDDDDEDEESEHASKGEDEGEGEDREDGMKVKTDPDAPPKKSTETLHEYTPDELARFKQKELTGLVELLDGKPNYGTHQNWTELVA